MPDPSRFVASPAPTPRARQYGALRGRGRARRAAAPAGRLALEQAGRRQQAGLDDQLGGYGLVGLPVYRHGPAIGIPASVTALALAAGSGEPRLHRRAAYPDPVGLERGSCEGLRAERLLLENDRHTQRLHGLAQEVNG